MRKTILAAVLTSVLIPGYAVALEDLHTGTVIVGSGISGLTTAILLKEHKQNVLVLEKMPFMGGTTNLAAQYFVSVGTKDQVANGRSCLCPITSREQLKPAEMRKCFRVLLKECLILRNPSTG